jgi:hypothetical protein
MQYPIREFTIGFDIDPEEEIVRVLRVDGPAVLLDDFLQRVEIKGPQCAIRAQFTPIVPNKKFTIDKKDVGFHTGEPMVQGVVERMGVPVIVVGVCLGQG